MALSHTLEREIEYLLKVILPIREIKYLRGHIYVETSRGVIGFVQSKRKVTSQVGTENGKLPRGITFLDAVKGHAEGS